jgi:hypothetical protein
VRLPRPPAERVVLARSVRGRLTEGGELAGGVRETYAGDASDAWRDASRLPDLPTATRRALDRRLAVALGSVRLDSTRCRWDSSGHVARLEFAAVAPGFGARGGKTLAFRPAAFPVDLPELGDAKERRSPLRLFAEASVDTTDIELPEGFRLSEPPPPASENGDFGSYAYAVRTESNRVIVERSVRIAGGTWPAERVADARAFFDRVRALDNRRVVAVPAR